MCYKCAATDNMNVCITASFISFLSTANIITMKLQRFHFHVFTRIDRPISENQSFLFWMVRSQDVLERTADRRLADGNVHCAGSVTYQICFKLRSRTRT